MRRFSRFVMVALVLIGVISVGCRGSGVDKKEFATLREEVRMLRTELDGRSGPLDNQAVTIQKLSERYEQDRKQSEQDRKILFGLTSNILYLEQALEFPGAYGDQFNRFVDVSEAIGNRVYMAQQLQQNGDRPGARSVMLSVFPYLANTCGSVSPVRAYLLPEELRWTLQGSGFHLAPDKDLQQEIDRENTINELAKKGSPKKAADYFSIVKDKLPGCR